MNMFKFIATHKIGVLSALLMVAAVALGADPGFAMAADPAELSPEANPSGNMDVYDGPDGGNTNPEGRPANEALQTDEQGGKTQLQGHAATGTDVRDAGLEADDYDKDVDNFRKFAFPIETYVARQCRPVKANSYVHGHYRTGSTDLETKYTGTSITISAAVNSSSASLYDWKVDTGVLKIAADKFDNAEVLKKYATITVKEVAGYKKDASGVEYVDGELVLFVMDHTDEWITFKLLNPPVDNVTPTTVTFAAETEFFVMATAGSESQMNVDPETFLPERFDVTLQKKIVTCTITDHFDEQGKKVPFTKEDVLAQAEYNFKRECARSHWNGTGARFDIKVKETGREAVYTENGILRQINMLYTFTGEDMTDDDLLALTTLMFTDNAMTDNATVFCGKKAMQRFIRLVNSADKYKDIGKVEVNNYGIRVRNYTDNFGKFEFVWDRTLDDLGYEDYMVILDLRHATRPYMRNDKQTTRDMSKTGEAREAKEYNLCRIDCVALNGFNSILVCPAAAALDPTKTGGIQSHFVSVEALPTFEGMTPEQIAAAKALKYYLTADDTDAGFSKGSVVEWDKVIDGWTPYEGVVRNA